MFSGEREKSWSRSPLPPSREKKGIRADLHLKPKEVGKKKKKRGFGGVPPDEQRNKRISWQGGKKEGVPDPK